MNSGDGRLQYDVDKQVNIWRGLEAWFQHKHGLRLAAQIGVLLGLPGNR